LEIRRLDKIDGLRAFVRVVDAGAFARAADSLAIPKSSITRQVQALEAELGVKLLHRTSRRLQMTEQGEAYYQGAVELLEQLARLDSSVKNSGLLSQGKIRVGMPNALAYHCVIPSLPAFMTAYPDIQIDVSVGNRTSDLIEHSIDCVIRVGELHNDSLIARSLGQLKMVTCAAPGYLARHSIPNHPSDLHTGHSLIEIVSPSSGRTFRQRLFSGSQIHELSGTVNMTVDDATAALTAGLAGLGVLTTYQFLVNTALESGELVQLFPDWHGDTAPVHIAWAENRHLPLKIRYFIDWVRMLFSTERAQNLG